MVQAGIDQAQPVAEAEDIHAWATAKGLSADQIDAAELTLTSASWATAIEGLAGTAKTTTVGAIREFARGTGLHRARLRHDLGQRQSPAGSGTSRRAPSPASWLTPCPPLPVPSFGSSTNRACWRPGRSIKFLTRHGNRASNGWSSSATSASTTRSRPARPLRQFLAANMAVAELSVIRRQRDPELKRAVELAARGKPDDALELLQQQQRVSEIPDATARYQKIAAAYLQAHEAGQTTLVVSPGNDERRALNQAIRDLLVSHGHVASSGARSCHPGRAGSDAGANALCAQLCRRRRDSFQPCPSAPQHRQRHAILRSRPSTARATR